MHLTASHVRSIVSGAEGKARDIGLSVAIAVVDDGANLKAFLRMDGAVLGANDIALRKAKTAILFQTDSELVWDYLKPGAPAHALELTNGGLAPFGGGLPLRRRDGVVIGALGISGGAVSQDVDVARAALAAFEASLGD